MLFAECLDILGCGDGVQYNRPMDPNTTDTVINGVSHSTQWMTILAGSVGGILVFIFGKLYNLFSWKLTEPKLRVEFDKNILGCITHTMTNDGRPAATIRMKATNIGKRAATALGCVVYLTNVEKQNENGVFESTGYCDSIRLAWSCQGLTLGSFGPMDIPRGVSQYVDIVSLLQHQDKFELPLEVLPNRYSKLFWQTGTFLFTVHVHTENASPVKCKLIFTWRHSWDGHKDSDAFEALPYKD